MGHAALDVSNEATAVGQKIAEAPNVWVLPLLTREQLRMMAMDVSLDYDFGYPSNLMPEIMAYECAVDFRAKGEKDVAALAVRLAGLWERFKSSIKRDE